MRKIAILFIFLLLVQSNSAGSYEPIKLKWQYPVKADNINSFDLDGDGLREIYISSYGYRNYLYALDWNGSLIFDTRIQGYREYFATIYPHADEEINIVYLTDLDKDKNLDILVSSKIWGTGVNVHKFYILERDIERGFDYYKNRFKWVYEDAGMIQEIYALNNEIISASLDGNIYIFDNAGNLKKNYDLGESIWGIFPADVDNDSLTEIVAGSFRGISLIYGNGIRWKYKTGGRILDVFSEDFDNDNYKEIIAVSDDYLYLLRMNGSLIWNKKIENPVGTGALDIDNDSKKEIIAVSRNGSIYFLGINGSVEWKSHIEDIILSAYTVDEKLFVGGDKNAYVFDLNKDYVRNLDAENYYSKSYDYYIKNDYENSGIYAEKAKEIYLEINNTDGILKSGYMLILTKQNLTSEEKKRVGDLYYDNAVKYLNSNKFEDALLYAERSLRIYSGINYSEGSRRSNLLISEINEGIAKNRKEEANNYYLKALDYYFFGKDLRNSTIYAEKAMRIYSELNDSGGISKSESLVLEIKKGGMKELSDGYYSIAQDYYNSGDYGNATLYAEKAGEIYLELNDGGGISKSDLLIALIRKHTEADNYYSIAQEFYKNKEYKNSGIYAKIAKDIYLELNDTTAITDSNTLILEIDKKTREKEIIDVLPIAAGIVVFVILLLFITRKIS